MYHMLTKKLYCRDVIDPPEGKSIIFFIIVNSIRYAL